MSCHSKTHTWLSLQSVYLAVTDSLSIWRCRVSRFSQRSLQIHDSDSPFTNIIMFVNWLVLGLHYQRDVGWDWHNYSKLFCKIQNSHIKICPIALQYNQHSFVHFTPVYFMKCSMYNTKRSPVIHPDLLCCHLVPLQWNNNRTSYINT